MNAERSRPAPPEISRVVEALCSASESYLAAGTPAAVRREFPSRGAIVGIVEDLRSVLFPGFFGPSELSRETLRYHAGATLDRVLHDLAEQIKRGIVATLGAADPKACEDCEERAWSAATAFLERLPELRRLLGTDVQAAYEGDPAASSPDEAIFCYPGILGITSQRIAHELYLLRVPLIPRLITEHAHTLTGMDIHPGARIGERFFVDHCTGVVIGETCEIGRNVRLYQGVTLGAKSFPLDEAGRPIKGIPRHPIVEDDVTIYANATVLGRITLGKGSSIGGNVWLTHSVPPGSVITQGQERNGMP
ncbi:MAG: serine acetyltransferase [Acidobacteria bacterium]|nr:serine acetyltransferase [Acidobacteriota bacterium]